MRARKVKTEIRQEQFAQAALKLVAAQGWQRVSLAAIARQVGVVTSAVYRHYKCKDDVLNAVLDLAEQKFRRNVQIARSTATEPVAQLHELLRRHVNLIVSGLPIPRVILSEEVLAGSARHRERVNAIYQAYLGEIVAVIRNGQAQGSITKETDAETLSLMWLGLVQSPAILWVWSKGAFDLQGHCERAWHVFAKSICTERCQAANGAFSRPHPVGRRLPAMPQH